MALEHHPRIITSGLVLYVDAANTRCYSGSGFTANGLIGDINGTLVNGAGYGTTNLGYFTFDGSNDYMDFGNSTPIQVSSGTMSAWVKTSSPGSSFRGIFAKQNAYGLFYLDSVLVAYDWGSATTRSTGVNIADGSWKNVAMTFQSGVSNGTIIYINGSSILTTTITKFNDNQNLYGGAEVNGLQYSNCIGANFSFYNKVLSAQEILQNYNALKQRFL